jgi:hypothetical protein
MHHFIRLNDFPSSNLDSVFKMLSQQANGKKLSFLQQANPLALIIKLKQPMPATKIVFGQMPKKMSFKKCPGIINVRLQAKKEPLCAIWVQNLQG